MRGSVGSVVHYVDIHISTRPFNIHWMKSVMRQNISEGSIDFIAGGGKLNSFLSLEKIGNWCRPSNEIKYA